MRALRKIKFVFIALAFLALFSLFTMLIWNWLIPDIFKGPTISYIQALGLLILSKILLGFGRFGPPFARHRHEYWRKRMHERWEKMTPEERENWKKRCGPWRWEDWEKEKSEASQPQNTA